MLDGSSGSPNPSVREALGQEERDLQHGLGASLRQNTASEAVKDSPTTAMISLWDEAGKRYHCAQEASSIPACHEVAYEELPSSFPANETSVLYLLLLLQVLN